MKHLSIAAAMLLAAAGAAAHDTWFAPAGGSGDDTLHVDGPDTGPLADNLVLRAIAAAREAVGRGPGQQHPGQDEVVLLPRIGDLVFGPQPAVLGPARCLHGSSLGE